MTQRRDEERRVLPLEAATVLEALLPYAVELWDLPRLKLERVLGRAATMPLALAIFRAAQAEHLGRRIRLTRGASVIAESG